MAGGAALAAPLVYATKAAMDLQTAMGRVQIATGASNSQMAELNKTLTVTANATGVFSKPKLAQFAADMYSSGIRDVKQINELLPMFAKGADVMKILSHNKIGPEESAHTFSALAHQFGKYTTQDMKPIIEAVVAMAPALPGGLKTFKGMGSYVNIIGNRALGIDPVQLLAFQAAIAQTSGGSGTGRGALSGAQAANFLQRSMPGIFGAGLLTGKSAFAAVTMGLGDKYGASTSIKDGKLDLQLLQQKIASFEKLSSLQMALRMKENVGMLGKKAEDELPLINHAIATGGKGVSKAQLLTQLMRYQYGASSTMAMLMGDQKFVGLQQRLTSAANTSVKNGGIERMQGQAMKLLEPQLMRLQTNFTTLASTIGTQMIPATTGLVTKLGDWLDKINSFAEKNPKLVQTLVTLTATASALLLIGGSLNIIKAGFMGLGIVFGPIVKLVPLIGTALAGLTAEFWVPVLALVAVVALIVAAVMNWKSIMKAAQPVIDAVTSAFRKLVMALSWVVGKLGGLIAMIPGLDGLGLSMMKAANGVASATRAAEAASKVHNYPGAVPVPKHTNFPGAVAWKPAPATVTNNTTNNFNVQQVAGHDHEACARTMTKKLGQAQSASSGNSTGRPLASRGNTRP